MKILILSRYHRLGASSRVRFFQYIPFLEAQGWQLDISPLLSDKYLLALYSGKSSLTEIVKGYFKRIFALMGSKNYDLLWIEKELFPFMPAFLERLATGGLPYVVDYDDAIFHRYDAHRIGLVRFLLGKKIDSLMAHASLVVAGNNYLAKRATDAGASWVEIVPTVVDISKYKRKNRRTNTSGKVTIGWIGSPATAKYLLELGPVIRSVSQRFNVDFVAIGPRKDQLQDLPVKIQAWSEDKETSLIAGFDLGIMPLPDSPWERGKCGYKLIQYMACGLPVIASPIGVNKEIVRDGENGFLARNFEEWEHALERLITSQELRNKMGDAGRAMVEREYSLQVQAPRINEFFKSVIKNRQCVE